MVKSYWKEEWKPVFIEGLPENKRYEISNYGRIKSYNSTNKEGVLIKGANLKGYNVLSIRLENKKSVTKLVHKLVAEAFVEKKSLKQTVVIHKDYDKMNNHWTNLQWSTREEMFAHHRANPNYDRNKIRNSKLTESKVKLIKRILKRNEENKRTRLKMIAKQFGITHTQLNRIRSGENWGHIQID